MHLLQNAAECCNRSASSGLKVVTIANDAADDRTCCRAERHDAKVLEISTDVMDSALGESLDVPDPFDRMVEDSRLLNSCTSNSSFSKLPSLTPGQQSLKEQLKLPQMDRYPVPVNCSGGESEHEQTVELLRLFQAFVLNLHQGRNLSQVKSSGNDYSDLHCQIHDDLQTFKVDQMNGRMLEFPLTSITRIYRIVRSDKKSLDGRPAPLVSSPSTEHIVVMEFMERKLALVFDDEIEARNFLMCMELLVRLAHEAKSSQHKDGKHWPQKSHLEEARRESVDPERRSKVLESLQSSEASMPEDSSEGRMLYRSGVKYLHIL